MTLETFSLLFVSLLLEGLPFVLLGSLIATLIFFFIKPEFVSKIVPKHPLLGIGVSGILGFLIPICECAIVPITSRLIRKGMPPPMAITLLLSAPLLNPLVIASTLIAFSHAPHIVALRIGVGFVIAILIGIGVHLFVHQSVLKKQKEHHHQLTFPNIMRHTSKDFASIGKFYIVGAIVAAGVLTFVSSKFLVYFGSLEGISIVIVMIAAFLLSVCSEADAFLIRSLSGFLSPGAITSFLVFGGMIDLKNMLMLLHAFKKRFVIGLVICIAILNVLAALLINGVFL